MIEPNAKLGDGSLPANDMIVQILLVAPVSKTLWKTLQYESSTKEVDKKNNEEVEINDEKAKNRMTIENIITNFSEKLRKFSIYSFYQ